jgi:hypothetical protein
MTFHGDPALRHHAFEGPDYLINHESVSLLPADLNVTTEEIDLTFEVLNIGAGLKDSLEIEILHEWEYGSNSYFLRIAAPANKEIISARIPMPGFEAAGNNLLFIRVDPANKIEESPGEQGEQNNILIDGTGRPGHSFFVLDNSAKPFFPDDFAIVNDPENIVLRAAVGNGLSPGGVFWIQLDTTELFDSPVLIDTKISGESTIIEWKPNQTWDPEQVYYWRIGTAQGNSTASEIHWRNRSFIFLPDNDPGWNQSHYYQWDQNSFHQMSISPTDRKLSFAERQWNIRIKNELNDPTDFWVFVNGTPWASLNPKELSPAICIFAWTRSDLIFRNNGNDFGSIPYSPDGFVYKVKDEEDLKNIADLLNAIPEGSRVFIHTILENEFSDLSLEYWNKPIDQSGRSFFDIMEDYGASKIRQFEDRGTVPYTYIFDKGKGAVIEDIANNIFETIDLSSIGMNSWEEGEMKSVMLGPAKRWKKLIWNETKSEEDQSKLQVFGVSASGQEKLLRDIVNQHEVDLASINPYIYPYLRLKYQASDRVFRSSPELHFWRTYFEELPDPSMFNDASSIGIPDTLNAGQNLVLAYDVKNFSSSKLEPLLIRYRLIDESGTEKVYLKRAGGIGPNEVVRMEHSITTDQLSGKYQVQIELNPNNDQLEKDVCNNFGSMEVFIVEDRINPLLDVTFNGQYLENEETIDENPEIRIRLSDAQSNVLLTDPEDIKITLYYPDIFIWQVDADDPNVVFSPAVSLDANYSEYILTPTLNIHGRYTLQVSGKDASGNGAGKHPYQVSFYVGDSYDGPKFRIYPNPAQDHLSIDYFHDKEVLPERFRLVFYSADGKRINLIDQSSFGGVRQGLNSFVWDLRDSSGRPLPNGLYYYQLLNNLDSSNERKRGSFVIIK